MFEYAISDGEGTLIDYGVVDVASIAVTAIIAASKMWAIIIAPCPDDCETGK